jgi:RNA polymerase sigma-70 factor (ECF subfamily)
MYAKAETLEPDDHEHLAYLEFTDDLVDTLPSLQRFALRCCRNPHDANDIVQSTCEKALHKWTQWGRQVPLEHWLTKILVNEWRDELRARNVRTTASLDNVSEPCSGPDDLMEEVSVDRVLEAADHLPAEQHDVIDLVVERGLSYRETALRLGIPIGTVMSRLSRARTELARQLGDTGAEAASCQQIVHTDRASSRSQSSATQSH